MKTYQITVRIIAENLSDLKERIEDTDNPIDHYILNSIKEIKED